LSIASSIPYGKSLRLEEMRDLTGQLLACQEPAYTSTGKKTLTILTSDELEKRL
jgi:DNA mismatch repair ATPase MutL